MSPASLLLRRLLLLAGPPALAACGGRADLETLSYQAVPNDNIPTQGGSGGSSAGSGGTAGAAGNAAGSGGSAGKGGSGGSAGASICNNNDPIPRTTDGSIDCGTPPDNSGSFGFCESRCYVPGPTTIPGPCRAAEDPALQNLPNFAPQTCGFTSPSRGPYCNAEAEKFAGNSPACCYLGFSFPCAGRPLLLDGHPSLAPLRRSSWA